MSEEKLGLWRKIGFGMGDIFGGGSMVVIGFYYLYFLTDVVRINPVLAGTAILVSKVYDAAVDPFIGLLTDRTRTRLGRRRPYLLAGIVLIFLSFFAMWSPAGFSAELQRFAYVIATYILFSTVISFVMVSYNALAAEMTLDYHERTSISSIRIFFSTMASIAAAVLPPEIVKLLPDVRTGYMVMAAFFGAFFALPFVVTVAATRERPEFQKPVQPLDLRHAFIEPFRVRTFSIMLLMYLFSFVAMDAVSSIVIYFMTYYMGRGPETAFVNGTMLVAQVCSLPLYVALSKRRGKKTAFLVGVVVWAASMLLSFFLSPGVPSFFVYVFAALVGLGTGGIVVMMYAIFPDIPDVDELSTGERREGQYAALISFSRTASSALAIFTVSAVMAWAGYRAPVERIVNGVSRLIAQQQTGRFILALRLLFVLVPILLLGLAFLFGMRYPLSQEAHRRLNRLLDARRRGEPETEELTAEAESLTRLLLRKDGA
jgi:oligogalacturonide transporter